MRKALRRIRDLAVKIINAELRNKRFQKKHVRASVFVPEMNRVHDGVWQLYVPDFLRDWDDPTKDSDKERHQRETEIRFSPNQGLVGKVFVTQTPDIAIAAGANAAPAGPDQHLVPDIRPD